MSAVALCEACSVGDHVGHIENWNPAPPGVLGGATCGCKGDCKPDPRMDALLGLMSTPTAPTPDQCRCKVVGWTRDPAEPHIPAQPEWEQADDCPVHPLTTAPTPDVADEREALVEVAARALSRYRCGTDNTCSACRNYARTVLDAVADRLVALGEIEVDAQAGFDVAEANRRTDAIAARLAEVEAERDEWKAIAAKCDEQAEEAVAVAHEAASKLADERRRREDAVADAEREIDELITRCTEAEERAEADMVAAEQRGAEMALREAADDMEHSITAELIRDAAKGEQVAMSYVTCTRMDVQFLRNLADHLATQTTNNEGGAS